MRNSRIGRLSLVLCASLTFVYALPNTPGSPKLHERAANFTPSLDVSGCSGVCYCPRFSICFLLALGYTLHSVKQTNTGLTASLGLAGPACNAFGHDIAELTIQVTYETSSRYVLALSFEIRSLTSSVLQYEKAFMSIYSIPQINNIQFLNLWSNVPPLLPSLSKVHRILCSITILRRLHSGSLAALSRTLRLCSTPESRLSQKRQYPL